MGANELETKLYRLINIWKRFEGKGAKLYRCFEILNEKRFCVQSSEYFEYPIKRELVDSIDDKVLFLELFVESAPEKRSETYASLEEAILMHEKEFEDFEIDVKVKT